MPHFAKPYVMQQHAALMLLGFGLIALLAPTTRRIMQIPETLEWSLFVVNAVVGVLLLRCRSLRWLDVLIVLAVATCIANALAFTFVLGVNTASWTYGLEVWFLTRLLGRVRADRERHGRW